MHWLPVEGDYDFDRRQFRRLLNQAANAAAKVKGGIFEIVFRRLLPRLGFKQSIWAIAHRLCRLMSGYLNNEVATGAVFRNGFFHTGDIGYQDGAGYVYMLDQLKEMIVTGGENVYSAEVEAVIFSHPAVREVAVFGIPDPKWGEIVAACVVLKPHAELTVEALTATPPESRKF